MRGINVPGTFVPGITKGYITEAKWIKGAYFVINSFQELSTIPEAALTEGTLAFVSDETKEYRWLSNEWHPVQNSFIEAPIDSKLYARSDGNWVEITQEALLDILNNQNILILNGNT